MRDGPFVIQLVEVAVRRVVDRMDGEPHCATCRNALHDIANELEKLGTEWKAARGGIDYCALEPTGAGASLSDDVHADGTSAAEGKL